MLIESLFFLAIGLIVIIPIGWVLIRIMNGPILAYEKIKKIFKIKDDSTIDNILSFATALSIILILYLIFDSGLIF